MGAMSDARIATGLAVDDAGVDAFAEAAGRAASGSAAPRPTWPSCSAARPTSIT